MTPDDLKAEIARAKAEVAKLLSYIEALETALRLTVTTPQRTIRTVDVQSVNLSGRTKQGAGRATRKHEGQRILYEQNMTIASLAKELGETRARVSKWFGAPADNRPIPRHVAELLLGRYGIPLSSWSRIGD